MSVCCECCVLSGRCLCVRLITCTEGPYRIYVCVCVFYPEVSVMSRLCATSGCCAMVGRGLGEISNSFVTSSLSGWPKNHHAVKSRFNLLYRLSLRVAVHTLLTPGSDMVLGTLCLRLHAYIITYCYLKLIVTAVALQDRCGLYPYLH
jgi:hypothetical protein